MKYSSHENHGNISEHQQTHPARSCWVKGLAGEIRRRAGLGKRRFSIVCVRDAFFRR